MMRTLAPPLELGQALRALGTLALTTLKGRLTYRMATLVSLLSNAVGYAVVLLVWRQVYADNPTGALVPKAALFPYLVTAFVLNFTLTPTVESRFGFRLRLGLITSDLLRPVGFLPFVLAQALGDAVTNLWLVLPVGALALTVFGGAIMPPDALAVALGSVSFGLAFLVTFGVSYLNVQAAFVTHNYYGIFFARTSLHVAFSGLMAPVALFPPALRSAADVLPFKHIIDTPVRIWLGQVSPTEALALLAGQGAWALGLIVLSSCVLSAALKRHQIQGG
jgi:ABC-2 type transport system permease protein